MEVDGARWERIQTLFHAALALPAGERHAFLERAAADPPMLAQVVAMLEEDARGASLLDADLAEVAQRVLADEVPPLREIGPYRIVCALGAGGMGVVYLAERADLGSRVAIKMLRDAWLSPARRERFASEQRTLAQLNHPFIARLYDADTLADGTPYFVMEYVEGEPLSAHVAARASTVAERLGLFRAVCEAVQYAHQQAVIHRDLKPSNILVTPGGAVRLLDFGIAKHLDALELAADQTQTALRLMTPAYAAPEQVRGDSLGVYTDVYALGVVLYQLLTGRLPFELDGLSPAQTETVILEQPPERPSQAARAPAATAAPPPDAARLGRAAWHDLDVLCLTAMHKDARRRYRSVDALIRDVDHYLRGEPLDARPDSVGYRLGKLLRRRRHAFGAAAAGLVFVVALVGFYTAQLAEQRNVARVEAAKARQVTEYLIGLFEASDPYTVEDGDGPELRTLLRRGVERAESLTGEPDVQAQMFDVLGRVHTMLSEYELADSLLQRAIGLRRMQGTPLDLAESLAWLGVLHVHTGELELAEAALREALLLREPRLPANHPDLASTLDELGVVLSNRGEYAQAESLFRRALHIRREIYREPHADLGSSLNNLAIALYNRGQLPAAESLYREALAVDRAVYGDEHPGVATDLANYARLLQDRAQYAEAESLLTEALRIRRTHLGDHHYETGLSLSQLGGLMQASGQLDRAERYLREALAVRERLVGPRHPGIATTRNGLGLVLQQRGDLIGAEREFRFALEIYQEVLGERHRFAGVAGCNLAEVLRMRGELQRSQAAYVACLHIMEELHPDDHHPELAFNRSRYGELLTALGRYGEAEPLLVAGHRALEAQLGAAHERTRAAARRVADLYDALASPARAAPYRRAAAP